MYRELRIVRNGVTVDGCAVIGAAEGKRALRALLGRDWCRWERIGFRTWRGVPGVLTLRGDA